jgi:NAD(P) transhydrogenase subunit alpha
LHPLLLIGIFAASTLVGYKLISAVPSLLHTPLMSSMNALSGVTVLGALAATGAAVAAGGRAVGFLAIVLAMVNVVGGFFVTGRMLGMFKQRKGGRGNE